MAAPPIDIGILTIRDDEFRAVLAAFPRMPGAGTHRGRREYALRVGDAGGGAQYTIAILRQIEQGNGEAQDAARDLLDELKPSLLLVVGIAGGLPSEDYTLGDVVVATRVNDYSVEARKARAKPTYSLSGGPIAKSLAASVANLAGRESDLGPWTRKLPQRPPVVWKRKGHLYGRKRWQEDVAESLETHFGRGATPRSPLFLAGAIASSDRLVKDPKILIPWLETARHILAVEMESGGVYRAARDRCLMLAIRGISDIVGLKRSNAWTKFACESAAAFTRAYLRTQPVPPHAPSKKTIGTPSTAPPGADKGSANDAPALDTLYVNLVPLRGYPATTYVAPTKCATYEQAWARLREGPKGHLPKAWVLHNKRIFSFSDPTTGPLARIVDGGAIEAQTKTWAEAKDLDQRRLFVHLVNGALKDDLGLFGVWHFHDDDVYMFAGRPDQDARKYKFQNVRLRSTITVVSHYMSNAKDGRSFPYLRHLAFSGRFRMLGGEWFLEVTPTYRFTTDGRKKYVFHEERLSGIKRLEGNRAVLSQVLLWGDVLTSPTPADVERSRWLTFGPSPLFTIERPISDEELTSIDAESVGSEEEPDEGAVPEAATP